MKRTLHIISNAYRAISEEQDDTILWLTQAMKGAGADVAVLLSGNAVNYLVPAQKVPTLTFGEWKQTHPPHIIGDLQSLAAKGIPIYDVQDEASDRGLVAANLPPEAQGIASAALPKLFETFDAVHNW